MEDEMLSFLAGLLVGGVLGVVAMTVLKSGDS